MPELRTRPLTPRFGVEIGDVDLREVGPDRLYPEIRDAFERHSALLFRDQRLGAGDHLRLARLFGPIEDRKADERAAGERFEVPEVSNLRPDGTVTEEMDLHTLNLKANQLWHTDSTFLPVPALANILVAHVVPERGGETELASTRAAFAEMGHARRARLRETWLRHRYAHSRARISPALARLAMFAKWPDRVWRAVWRNPATGEEAIYVASHAVGVEGMEPAAGAALVDALIAECTRPGDTYLHRWRPGDVLIWDERATLHRGRPWDYARPRRLTSLCVSATEADGLAEMRPPG